MTTFTTAQLQSLFYHLLTHKKLHCLWLNTLSYMEFIGSKKIGRFMNSTLVTLDILKHSAEEARHAWFFKQLIDRIDEHHSLNDYRSDYILAPIQSKQYLHALDYQSAKLLLASGKTGEQLKNGAYILVTYAIEKRAERLYPAFQEVLNHMHQPYNIKSVIAEEVTHLDEMEKLLSGYFGDDRKILNEIMKIEEHLFSNWIHQLFIETEFEVSVLD